MQNSKYPCDFDFCQKSFTAKKSLQEHIRIHKGEKPYECTDESCQKKFTQYSSFQKHLRIHKGEKPYKCNEDNCNHSFSQISNLNRHKRIHTKEKPFLCEKCSKGFTTTSNLKQHLQTHSSNEQREKYQCNTCHKTYFYPSSLRKHNQYHTSNGKNSNGSGLPLILKHRNHYDMVINGYLYMFQNNGEMLAHELEESEENPIRCLPLDEKQHSNSFKSLGALYYSVLNEINERNNIKMTKNEEDEVFHNNHFKEEDQTPLFNGRNGQNQEIDREKFKEMEENFILEKEKCLLLKTNGKNICDHKFEQKVFFENENNEEPEKLKSEGPLEEFFSFFVNTKENNFSDQLPEINSQGKFSFDFSEFCLLCEKKKESEKHKHGPGCGHSIMYHGGHIDYIVEGILHFPHEEHCDDHGKVLFE